jgi:hypothetical protein
VKDMILETVGMDCEMVSEDILRFKNNLIYHLKQEKLIFVKDL